MIQSFDNSGSLGIWSKDYIFQAVDYLEGVEGRLIKNIEPYQKIRDYSGSSGDIVNLANLDGLEPFDGLYCGYVRVWGNPNGGAVIYEETPNGDLYRLFQEAVGTWVRASFEPVPLISRMYWTSGAVTGGVLEFNFIGYKIYLS